MQRKASQICVFLNKTPGCISVAISPNTEHNIRGAELHHHLPHAHQYSGPVHQEGVLREDTWISEPEN